MPALYNGVAVAIVATVAAGRYRGSQGLLTSPWLPSLRHEVSAEVSVMIPPQELLRYLQRRPFEPFRVHLTDGVTYDVRHPEMVLPATLTAEIGLPADPAVPIAERIVTVSLVHMVRLEPLGAPTPGNGQAGG